MIEVVATLGRTAQAPCRVFRPSQNFRGLPGTMPLRFEPVGIDPIPPLATIGGRDERLGPGLPRFDTTGANRRWRDR
jgi:hypothetical protein